MFSKDIFDKYYSTESLIYFTYLEIPWFLTDFFDTTHEIVKIENWFLESARFKWISNHSHSIWS